MKTVNFNVQTFNYFPACKIRDYLYLDHEALDEDVVGAGAAGDDVGQVGQLLDQDDTADGQHLDL